MPIHIVQASPSGVEATELLNELSARLSSRFGGDGRSNFKPEDEVPGSFFLVAYDGTQAVGCAAMRPITAQVGEVKRMYTREPGRGIGTALLGHLEDMARAQGRTALWLETRRRNQQAVNLYLRNGYTVRKNYGPYIGRPDAVCFEKPLAVSLPSAHAKPAGPSMI